MTGDKRGTESKAPKPTADDAPNFAKWHLPRESKDKVERPN